MTTKKSLILYLISQELKSLKLFELLRTIGMADSWLEPHLEQAILTLMKIDYANDKVIEMYVRIIDREVRKVNSSSQSIKMGTDRVYKKLLALRLESRVR